MPSTTPALSLSPPVPDALARRRSQSARSSSASSSSFRSSLGGKPIGQKYHGVPKETRRATGGAEGVGAHAGALAIDPDGSRISLGSSSANDSDEAGYASGIQARMGAFSHTRDELRDSSARLASLSLSIPTPLASPSVERQRPSLRPSTASAPVVTPSNSSFTASPALMPADDDATPRLAPLPSSCLQPSPSPPSSASNLARARPDFLSSKSTGSDDTLPTASTSAIASTSGATTKRFSPSSQSPRDGDEDDGLTPTQSNMGSLHQPPVHLGGSSTPPAQVSLSSPSSLSPEQREIRALGDESGGISSDEEEDRLVRGEIAREQRLGARQRTRRQKQHAGESALSPVDERTPLLGDGKSVFGAEVGKAGSRASQWIKRWKNEAVKAVKTTRSRVGKEELVGGLKNGIESLPAVVLGVLMNILDGVSYGMIMFPTNIPAFADFGGIGVSMFFVSCVVSQVVYSGGGSIFKAGNGSMMIEVVPFFHSIVAIIQRHLSDGKSLVATTMVSFAFSSILTGIAFGLLGYFKLGSLSEFFPRHILVGCIGGVGAFLFVTGFQVSARLEEDAGLSMDLLRHFFDSEVWPLWLLPLGLAVTLRLITARYHHPLIFPGFFLAIPIVFYAVALSAGFSIEQLREKGWVFEVNGVDSEWYEYWTLFDFKKTDFDALLETVPTQLALVFFGLLHVPINVPALGISVGEDNVRTDRELIAHGISNVAAGMLGTVPNYLCYVNSVLFYRVAGGLEEASRLSGFLLALASFGVLVAGPGIISVLPVSIVGALIFILGIDLIKEAIYDTYGRVARFEYVTIWCILILMAGFDFVTGIGAGIVLACVSFVFQSSQRRAVRAILSGSVARSTVRRHPKQSAFLKEVGRQTRIMKLQGFLFFGTISGVETTIRKILEAASWSKNPIRFLVLDFSMASGVDFSAAEAFVRIQRLLEDKQAVLVLCGCPASSNVGIALRSVDLWADSSDDAKVEVFENLNDALEHTENAFLRSLYSRDFAPPTITGAATPHMTSQIDVPKAELDSDVESFTGSPRASHLRTAAKETMVRTEATSFKTQFQQPLPILMQSLKPFAPELNEDYFFRLVPYFKRQVVERGTKLWSMNDESDSFYLIESGMLRATYVFPDRSHSISESMVAGTVSGEMTFLSRSNRNANVVVERDSILWRMTVQDHQLLAEREGWTFASRFEQCLLRIASEEQDVLIRHLISSL